MLEWAGMQGFAWPKAIDVSPKLSSRGISWKTISQAKDLFCTPNPSTMALGPASRWGFIQSLWEAWLARTVPNAGRNDPTPLAIWFWRFPYAPIGAKDPSAGAVICGKLAVATSPERSFHHSYHPAARTSVSHSLSVRSKIFFVDICGMLSWQTTQQHVTCSKRVGCMTHHDTTSSELINLKRTSSCGFSWKRW